MDAVPHLQRSGNVGSTTRLYGGDHGTAEPGAHETRPSATGIDRGPNEEVQLGQADLAVASEAEVRGEHEVPQGLDVAGFETGHRQPGSLRLGGDVAGPAVERLGQRQVLNLGGVEMRQR